jgi:hypothetical protein
MANKERDRIRAKNGLEWEIVNEMVWNYDAYFN